MKHPHPAQLRAAGFCALQTLPLARLTAIGMAATLALSACAPLPDTKARPDLALRQTLVADMTEDRGWWRSLNDPVLDRIEARALADNLSVSQAIERVIQARQSTATARAALLPDLDGVAGVQRGALSETGPAVASGSSPHVYNLYDVGVQTRWELDLFGGTRASVKGAKATALSAQAKAEAAALALTAQIATAYIELRAAQADLQALRDTLKISNRAVSIASAQLENGVAGSGSLASARAQKAQVAALVPQAEARISRMMNTLALLCAAPPHALDAELKAPRPIPALRQIPKGISSDAARNRPDILAAQQDLQSAIASREAARADFYPKVVLTGYAGKQGLDASDLGLWGARNFSVGPSLTLPLFKAGKVASQYALSQSREREAALAYRETVLAAWGEVDNGLTATRKAAARRAALEEAVTQYDAALRSAERNYSEGLTEYLPQLVAERDLLAARRTEISARADAALAAVGLFKAVGGRPEGAAK